MPVSRMRMRPWLEDRIESKSISGLVWVDKEKKMFSIPWKHAARHGWQVDKDACLFKQWAIHTGKFKPGVTNPDPKTWKANFRCAMNSLPDIEEVKDRSVNKGCAAVRVYRMLQVVSKKRDKKSSKEVKNKSKGGKSKVKVEDQDSKHSSTSMDEDSMQENTVDSTLEHLGTDVDLSPSPYGTGEEAPDWSSLEEIGPDSTVFSNFQVSPLHPTDLEDEAAIIEMAQQLEQDQSQWLQSNINGKGFLSNEVGTAESFHSPESKSSDNSGEEIEFTFCTEYTELTGRNMDLVSYLDPWTGLPQQCPSSSYVSPMLCPL
ncbi:hypothetical protein AAFF_G00245860 [Aldrovandia affinis]|uniref:Interferon regulatory factor n=1 Tax=Aldrovandia affinis TaxID=143900 RepID=A0AAD7SV44_9TELE|nr:hypothetical protein AAFF_G00245860 [Aldrovandia affinis]